MALKQETIDKMVKLMRSANEEQLMLLNTFLVSELKSQRRLRAVQTRQQMASGTRVRIVQGIKPRYLAGLTGTVTSFKGDSVEIRLDCGPINRFRTGTVIFRNASALEVLP